MTTVAQDIRVCETLKSIADRLTKQADVAKAMENEAWHDLAVRMQDEEIDGQTTRGYNYVPEVKTHAVVQDKEAFVRWARAHAPEMITGEPRRKLINEKVEQCLDSGQPLPPGLGYYPEPKVSRRKR